MRFNFLTQFSGLAYVWDKEVYAELEAVQTKVI